MAPQKNTLELPVVGNPAQFDAASGNRLERLVFNYRAIVLLFCALMTLVLGWEATRLPVNANFERMIPLRSPYIRNYLQYKNELPGLGNTIRVVVENKRGDIYDADYLEALRKVNDALMLIPGVDRSWTKSLWLPIVRWKEVTEEGLTGGPVMPATYKGDAASIAQLRDNIAKAGIVGTIVAADGKSSMIIAPLLDRNPQTGGPLNYAELSRELELQLRSVESDHIGVHIVGFGKLVGELIAGLGSVVGFFGIAVAIAAILVFFYTRCLRSTALLVASAVLGVVWLLGLMQLLGYELDPYSILTPFLIFAIGLSHGAQKMNGILQDIGRGIHRYVAARYTFRRLFLPGLTALLTNVFGFAVLVLIDIPVIRDLAVTTSIGVTVLVFTKLVLIPVALSYIGVSPAAAARAAQEYDLQRENHGWRSRVWRSLDRLTERRPALYVLAGAAVLTVVSAWVMRDLRIGDLDPGAPELRAESRYNRDTAFITQRYGLTSDQFAVIMKTDPDVCRLYRPLRELDQLGQVLRETPGVVTTASLAEMVRHITVGAYEGNPKWYALSRNQDILNVAYGGAITSYPDAANSQCSVVPLVAYLADHKAETLKQVLGEAEKFARASKEDGNGKKPYEFLLAAGSAGIEAATNIEVERGIVTMYLAVYGATALLCLLTFRSIAATIVALVPLAITSVLCKALMVGLGIGLKAATLPVIAVGVGVGVDYALYLLSIQLAAQRAGMSLKAAYRCSLDFTGRVVALVGLTMTAGVVTWAWSPIKFQADMGILLAFMFLWNMVGALVMIPALSHFLLQKPSTR